MNDYLQRVIIGGVILIGIVGGVVYGQLNSNNVSSDVVADAVLGAGEKVELPQLRTYKTKTFDNGDGTKTVDVFGTDIHYKDNLGDFQDVDIQFTDMGAYWQMTQASYRLYVAKDFSANQLIRFDNRYEGANHTIYYEPKTLAWVNNPDLSDLVVFRNQQSVQGIVTGNKIRWTDAFGAGIHFEVTLRASGFKKEIIVDAKNNLELPPTADHKLAVLFRYQGDGLRVLNKLGQEWDKSAYFEDEDGFDLEDVGAHKSFIRPAYITDSSIHKNPQSIKVFWKLYNGSLWQAKVLPKTYLNNATYPIRADTVTDFSATSGGDGDITSGPSTFANVRTGTSLSVDKVDTQGNLYQDPTWYLRRLYFPFDTSSIPDADTVTAATITLTHPHINYLINGSRNAAFVDSAQSSGTNLTTSDWTPTSFTPVTDEKSFSSISAGGSNSTHTWTFSDLTQISKTGYTMTQLLGESDYENDSTTNSAGNYVDFYYNEESTSTRRPKLSVTYTAGATEATTTPYMLIKGDVMLGGDVIIKRQ